MLRLAHDAGKVGSAVFRNAIFQGALYRAAESAHTRLLVEAAHRWLEGETGDPCRALARRWRARDWPHVRALQSRFHASAEMWAATLKFVTTLLGDEMLLVDHPRLRIVFPDGHEVPAAKPAYLAHRDTWFANPQTQINWWIPLLPVDEDSSFGFAPDYFGKPIPNSSASFDYCAWKTQGGFQAPQAGSIAHPTATTPVSTRRFRCEPGEFLCFSAAHLHQTLPVRAERARLSIDFRTVSLCDEVGAQNVDNQSRGDASEDYERIGHTSGASRPG